MYFYTEIDRRKRDARTFGVCPECGDHRRLVQVFGVTEWICQLCAIPHITRK